MKSHLAKVSLALISAAFLFGCQEQASSPVGLEGPGPQFAAKKCLSDSEAKGCKDTKEGGQGGVPALLEMRGGMTTTSGQPVDFQDGENTLVLNNPMPIEFAMALAETRSAAMEYPTDGLLFNTSICVPFSGKRANPSDAKLNTLFATLIDGERNRRFFVHIDKNALGDNNSPNEHTISINWEDDNNEKFSVSVGKLSPTEPGRSTVTLIGDLSSGVVTVTFTGGSIRLRNRTGRVQQYFNLTCPIHNDDVITMDLSLPEAD